MKLPHSNTSSKLNSLIILIVILITQTASTAIYAQSTPPGNAQDNPPPKELQIADPVGTRSGLMGYIRGLDTGFVFRQDPDIDGQQEFSAKDYYNSSVEIIGSERDPQTVKWTIAFTANRDVNIKETFRLGDFLEIVGGKEATQWFSEQWSKNLSVHPLDDYTETKEFEARKIRFEYRPRLRQASMVVYMKK